MNSLVDSSMRDGMMTSNRHSSDKLPGKRLELEYPNPQEHICKDESIKISLYVNMNVGIGGDIWPASHLFCQLLTYSSDYYLLWKPFFDRKRVLELGSGNGFISILLDKIYPCISRITISDMADHLELIRYNLNLNDSRTGKYHVEEVNWLDYREGWGSSSVVENKPATTTLSDAAEAPPPPHYQKYDVILALECVYKEELYLPLINTILHYSHPETKILLGMTKSFISSRFFDYCKQKSIYYEKLPFHQLEQIFQSTTLYPNIEDLKNIGIFSLTVATGKKTSDFEQL